MVEVTLLDYGAGNVRSVRNAIRAAGHIVKDAMSAEDIRNANVLIFPGVGNFRKAMEFLISHNYVEVLTEYIKQNKKFLGICLGMQTLFEGSEECPELKGLGIIKGQVTKFPTDTMSVPHIGWNGIKVWKKSCLFSSLPENIDIADARVYFVHSYRATKSDRNSSWVLTTTNYGNLEFISSIQKGNVMATQFHPEKSGSIGIAVLRGFLENCSIMSDHDVAIPALQLQTTPTQLAKRIIACLDVRTNDAGDLVVTKGDQYDVREAHPTERGGVRNMGKPVDLCTRYYNEGADEVTFLNICSFREQPIGDMPMLQVLEASSEKVFVPLTVGGGIREYIDDKHVKHSALDVASRYFRSGADKVSIGSDAVYAAEEYYASGNLGTGLSSIEQISSVYGKQAVVISLDPKRVYVASLYDENAKNYNVIRLTSPGPNGEEYCWYQATVRGGREARDIDVVQVAKACEALGAGEILLNCVDMDGQKAGYDLTLVNLVKKSVSIPVIASSGAGIPQHFTDVFRETDCEAALAAGIFHRNEVGINEIKEHLRKDNICVRL